MAFNCETGQPIGVSAAFPRLAHPSSVAKKAWVLGDFCISEEYRTLGPALQLQRATLNAIAKASDGDFFYDFPSRQFTAVYQRMRIPPAAQILRLAKPLRVDGKLRKVGSLARPAGSVANFILKIADFKLLDENCIVELHHGYCDREFTELLEKSQHGSPLSIARSADYLNWRYVSHPRFRHQILTARKRDGKLQGYLVFNTIAGNARISEWFCAGDDRLLVALVRDAIRRLRSAGAATVSAFLSEKDPRLQLFKKMGFWPRESCPFIVHWSSSAPSTPDFFPMHGDRDV